jgi:hypothetical protein
MNWRGGCQAFSASSPPTRRPALPAALQPERGVFFHSISSCIVTLMFGIALTRPGSGRLG